MNSEWFALIISCFNLVVFVVSVMLIYRQLRQMEKSIRGNTYQSLIEEAASINRIFVDNPQLAELWGSVKYVGAKGDPNEIRKNWVITMIMDFYENMYFQYEQGNIPKEIWERWRRHIINVFKNTEVRDQWDKAKDVYYEPFRKFINKALYGDIDV